MGSQVVWHFLYSSCLIMTQTQWDDIYTSLYEVYEQVSLIDEQTRSTIGDALDRLIDINPRNKK